MAKRVLLVSGSTRSVSTNSALMRTEARRRVNVTADPGVRAAIATTLRTPTAGAPG